MTATPHTTGSGPLTAPAVPAAPASYVEPLLAALAQDPDRPALIDADRTEITAGALHATVHRMAAVLTARGIGRGRTVSLLSNNRPEVLAARYAANLVGARVVFLYVGTAPEVLARIAGSVDTALLLVDPDLYDAARALLAHLPGPAPEVMTFGPVPAPAGDVSADTAALGPDLIAACGALSSPERTEAGPSPVPEIACAARPEDEWCIRHTGGTTGIPKGVRMVNAPYAAMLAQQLSAPAGERPRFLACTSLAHLAGIFADTTLTSGGTVVLHPAFDPAAVLAAIARDRITHLWLLPPLLHRLLDDPALPATDLGSLTSITYGGCPASPSRLAQAAEVFGPVLYGMYGMSEAMLISVAGPEEHTVTGPGGRVTVGRPLPGVELAVRDTEGRALPPGEQGEVHVRSAGVMPGYWQQPEATAQVLGEDGWLRTGDIGCLDDEGYLFLVDRSKDVIIVVGGHVHPAEVEDLLHAHPAVAQCAVYGVRTADETEQVHTAIVPAPGHDIDPDDIRAFVEAHKGTLYVPAAVHVLDTLPLTPVGKPDKNRLRAAATPS
ncbi:AMP-binding protein [Streptomyces natalensis]|uniref:AMP-binding protein n=1 Tax=Streptomyces natalensis TaxID=68242 RepID=UPI00099B5DA3|nr:AMP-binding protein [Streptomyces natalensis]